MSPELLHFKGNKITKTKSCCWSGVGQVSKSLVVKVGDGLLTEGCWEE